MSARVVVEMGRPDLSGLAVVVALAAAGALVGTLIWVIVRYGGRTNE